jgi:hypothetical protein
MFGFPMLERHYIVKTWQRMACPSDIATGTTTLIKTTTTLRLEHPASSLNYDADKCNSSRV